MRQHGNVMKPQNEMKMKKSYTYLTMLLTVFAFASCVKEFDNPDKGTVAQGTPIEFTISDEVTRTLLDLTDGKSLSWEDGDQVGLYYRSRITGETNQDKIVAENVPYEYDAQTGKFVPVDQPATWEGGESGNQHDLYVYYPYSSEAKAYNSIARTIPTTQTYDVTATANPIAQLGFAGTRALEATYGAAVEFPALSQSFAIFRLNITNTTSSDVNVSSVEVSNDSKVIAGERFMSMVQFVGSAPKISGSGGSKSVTVNVENGVLKAGECIDVRLVMIPDDYTGSKFSVTVTSDKGGHPIVEFDGGNIAIGGRASKNIVLQAPSEAETPEYEIGQVVGGGVLYKIDGDTGYVLYPYAGKAKFATSESKMSSALTKDEASGEATMAILKAQSADLSDYPAAKYCSDLGEGWYLPARDEWVELFDVFTGNDTENQNIFKYPTSDLASKYKEARAQFEGYLTACGGDVLSTPEEELNSKGQGWYYWIGTITGSGTTARYTRIDNYTMTATASVTSSYKVRCIKQVDLTALDQPETEVEETYPAPVAGEEGEYDVYLLIGQSNMAGRGELLEEDYAEIPNVYLLDSEGTPVAAKNPMNIYSSIRKAGDSLQQMGPGASFASTVVEQTGRKLLLVVNARGGSAIAEWAKGATATSPSFYDEAVRRTQQAMEYGALKGILWHQGCSDQKNTTYMTQLTALAKDLRNDFGADVPFIVGQLGDWRSSSANFNTNIQNVNDYLIYSDWVSSQGCVPIITEESNGQPDLTDPHFNRASQITMGKRYAQKILKMVYEKDYTVE